ncbi:MAG: hypothetical protein AAGI25_04640, partial [Bacteroidota bacterium]
LKRLGLGWLFHRSFSTTNCIENLNAQLNKYLHNVKRWRHSQQRYRWVTAALLEIQTNMRKVVNYKHLQTMREKLIEEMERVEQNQNIHSSTA